MVNLLAASEPNLTAGVAFYGGPAPVEQVPKIRAALHLIYAGNDKRVNSIVGPYLEALKRAKKNFTTEVYPNVNHAFHNDTSSARYNEKAAKDAWAKALAFFKKNLG
jgi:carboxymethylenebutenolidase